MLAVQLGSSGSVPSTTSNSEKMAMNRLGPILHNSREMKKELGGGGCRGSSVDRLIK